MALKSTRIQTFMLVNQPTSGVFVTPSASTDAIYLEEGGYDTPTEKDETAPSVAWFTPPEFFEYNERLVVNGRMRCVGHPTAGTIGPVDLPLRLAGHTSTVVATNRVEYEPTPTGSNFVCSARHVIADEANDAADVKARVDEIKWDVDKEWYIGMEFQGGKVGESDLATPSGTYANLRKAIRGTTENTVVRFGGVEIPCRSISIKPNATLTTIPDSMVRENDMTNRLCAIEIKVKKEALSAINFHAWSRDGVKRPFVAFSRNPADLPAGVRLDLPLVRLFLPTAIGSVNDTGERTLTGYCYADATNREYKLSLGDVLTT